MSQAINTLFQAGDTIFFDLLRARTDAATLRQLARLWLSAVSPGLRSRLLLYLDQPLQDRHRPLIVALVRRAARARDDEVMARMLLLFDRCLKRDWLVSSNSASCGFLLRPHPLPSLEADLRDSNSIQFSVEARVRVRRFVWRYFRWLGRRHPQRYVSALVPVLKSYTDSDVGGGYPALDRWGLLHVLYHHSTLIRPGRTGWYIKAGLAWLENQLEPAPAYKELWTSQPLVLFDLVRNAESALVRRWAARLLGEMDTVSLSTLLPLEDLLEMLSTQSDRMLNAADLLKKRGGLEKVPASTWVRLLRTRKGDLFRPLLLELLQQPAVNLSELTLTDLVELACSPWQPVASFGWNQLLNRYHESPEDFGQPAWLLDLLRRPHPSLRQAMAPWLRETFAASGPLSWVFAFFQAEYSDVQDVAWEWFRSDPVLRVDQSLWTWLVRHSVPKVRRRFLDFLLEFQQDQPQSLSHHLSLEEQGLAVLRARVLLTVHCGWGHLPRLVDQLRVRLEEEWPGEAESLVCLLAEVLHGSFGGRQVADPSLRGALAAVVKFVANHPEQEPVLERELPGLQRVPADRPRARSVP